MAKKFRLFKPYRYCDCHKYSEDLNSAETWGTLLYFLEMGRFCILLYWYNHPHGVDVDPLLSESDIPGLMKMCNDMLNFDNADFCETLVTILFVASFFLAYLKAVVWNFLFHAITIVIRNEICPPTKLCTGREEFEMNFTSNTYNLLYILLWFLFYGFVIFFSVIQLAPNYDKFYSKILPSFSMALQENQFLIEQVSTSPVCFPLSPFA